MIKFLLIILLKIAIIQSATLLPYGPSAGDSSLPACDDCYSSKINISPPLTFYGTKYSQYYVSNNGVISFKSGVSTYTPNAFPTSTDGPIVALYWSDIDTTAAGKTYFRTQAGPDPTYDAYIALHLGLDFTTQYKIVVTYDKAGYFNSNKDKLVTAQGVIYVSNNNLAVSCFNYPTDGINWVCGDASGCSNGFPILNNVIGVPAQVGYNAGDGKLSYTLPGSRTTAIQYIDTGDNLNTVGQYCYRIDPTVIVGCAFNARCLSGSIQVPMNRAPILSDINNLSAVCDATPSLSIKSAFTCANVGISYPLTLTVGTSSCTATIVPYSQITYSSCPSSINLSITSCTTTVDWSTSVTADCSFSETKSHLPNSSIFYPGVTTVTYIASDIFGKSASCSFTVTIISNPPAPSLSTIPNVITSISSSACSTTAPWSPPTVSNACDSYTLTSNYQPDSSLFPIKSTTTVTYNFLDSKGKTASTSFTVQVNDAKAPVVTCPTNIIVNADSGRCDTHVAIASPSITECTSTTTTNSLTSGSSLNVGSYSGTYTVTDSSNNIASCTYSVSVLDTQSPSLTCSNSQVYANTNCVSDGSLCLSKAAYTIPSFSDNCAATLSQTSGITYNSFQQFGSYPISYSVTDSSSNTVSCSLTLQIIGIQFTYPTSNTIIYQGEIVNFTFSSYLPSDTQAIFRIINVSNGRAVRASLVNLTSTSISHTFVNTAYVGMYSATLTGATSGVQSVANPTFRICSDSSHCP